MCRLLARAKLHEVWTHCVGRNEIPSLAARPLCPRSHAGDLWVTTD